MATKLPKRIAAAQGRDAAAALRKFWRAGKRSLRRFPLGAVRPGGAAKALAEEGKAEHLNPDSVAKARKFASEYDTDALEAICARIERHGAPFGPTGMIRLLTVPWGERKALLNEALRQRWSSNQVEAEVLRRYGRRRQGGRRPRIHTDLASNFVTLERLSNQWVRWADAAEKIVLKQLPRDLRTEIDKATRAVARVHRAVSDRLAAAGSSRRGSDARE